MSSGDDGRGSDREDPDRSVGPGEAVDGDSDDSRTVANETASASGDEGEDGWRFSLDDVDEDGIVTTEIEPEELDLENAAFVVLGAIAMVLVFFRLSMLVG